jgi:mannose-1-phosphate guanylyltransferase
MERKGNRWCIVLAAGDGTRLRSLTTDRHGNTTPKQYCSLRGDGSLLQKALARADRIAPPGRVVTIVSGAHERWWKRELAGRPAGSTLVQPLNRGTAPGLLLPLLEVIERDPGATVLVLPSDHHVRDEAVLARAARRALAAVERRRAAIVLLGISPDAAVADYGWIVPAPGPAGQVQSVASFVEKPAPREAARLLRAGGLWNSFLFAARAADLLALMRRRLPWLSRSLMDARAVEPSRRARSLDVLYEAMLPADFSRDVLQGAGSALHLLRVPACGWTDLGTPERVASCLEDLDLPRAGSARRAPARPAPDLLWNGMVLLSSAG